MNIWVGGALAVAATVAVVSMVEAGIVRQTVRGRLPAVDTASAAKGIFTLTSIAADNGNTRESVSVDATRLDATADAQGNLPDYHLVLTTLAGAESDFGSLRLNARGRGRFEFNSRTGTYPDGVTTITSFTDGAIEVRLDGTAVLSGLVPTFRNPGDTNGSGSGAHGIRRDTHRLTPVTRPSRLRCFIEARYANAPRGTNEQIKVQCEGLDRAGAPYALVVIDGSSNETQLFELSPHGRFRQDRGVIDTREGDTIPGGSVTDLSDLSVELRDKDGTAVMTGTFPTISIN
ncbi:MAG: hypothetical protein K8T90_17640 [Planctomycetes bacterium]|nr:hypothetical protein [Planctomycetota bacterium]